MAVYEFEVTMTCEGCVNAVNRVLNRLDGVQKVGISLEEQKVEVVTDDSLEYQTVYDTIAKTGKKITSGKTL
ncbi:copper metallochaperone [Starmerella bacillaris]|uniref:Copper metallochaperone n=1 Tax=Starmerella bacillaris TaxID=1247836 RepID=A0AAV5RL26_STABA|nr:copper metallochaperone [Starmerella bacillaris]